jgi:hypothetical protein
VYLLFLHVRLSPKVDARIKITADEIKRQYVAELESTPVQADHSLIIFRNSNTAFETLRLYPMLVTFDVI